MPDKDEYLTAIKKVLAKFKNRVTYKGAHKGIHTWQVEGLPHPVRYMPDGNGDWDAPTLQYGAIDKNGELRKGGRMDWHSKPLLVDLELQLRNTRKCK